MKRQRTKLLPRTVYVRDARIFVVAVEGEREEPWYFKGLAEHDIIDTRRVRLVVLPASEGLSAPEHVAGRLSTFESEQSLEPSDPRWIVVDVDRHKNLSGVLAEASHQHWRVAVSNPCFEIWLQLHVNEHPSGADSQSAKAEWGRLRNGLGPGWPFEVTHVDAACRRAKDRHTGGGFIPDAPGSGVYALVEDLPRRGA